MKRDNYFKRKKKYEILNKMLKMQKESFIYLNATKEMMEEYNKILKEISSKNAEK